MVEFWEKLCSTILIKFFLVVGDFGGSYTVIYIMLQYCPEVSFNWNPKICWTHATNNYKYIQHTKKLYSQEDHFYIYIYIYTHIL
jgi:hypothetical protein